MSLAESTLRDLVKEVGYPPTVEEYRERIGVGSKRTALRYLKRLEETGVIRRYPGARGIIITDCEDPTISDTTAWRARAEQADRMRLETLSEVQRLRARLADTEEMLWEASENPEFWNSEKARGWLKHMENTPEETE